MTEDLYTTKRSLELEWQQEHLKSGKVNLKMIEINREIKDVIKQIIAREFEEATRENKIAVSKPEVSIATYALSPKSIFHNRIPCALLKIEL